MNKSNRSFFFYSLSLLSPRKLAVIKTHHHSIAGHGKIFNSSFGHFVCQMNKCTTNWTNDGFGFKAPYPTSSDSSPQAAPLVGINYSSRWWWLYRNRAWTLSIEHRFQCLLRPRGRIPGQRYCDDIQISLYFAPLSSCLCLLLRVDQKLIEWFYFWLEYLPSLTRPRRVLIPGAAPTADGRDY